MEKFAIMGRCLDRVLALAAGLAGALMVGVMLIVCAKVALRYFFNIGIVGIDQISGTSLLYITFLSAAWVLQHEGHVTIDILVSGLGQGARKKLNVVVSLISAAVCLIVAIFGVAEVVNSWRHDIRIASEIEILRAYNLAIIPLGAGLLFLQFLRRARVGAGGVSAAEQEAR